MNKTLEFFCIENKDRIVSCLYIDSKYCLKSCKYYDLKKQESKHTDYKKK